MKNTALVNLAPTAAHNPPAPAGTPARAAQVKMIRKAVKRDGGRYARWLMGTWGWDAEMIEAMISEI